MTAEIPLVVAKWRLRLFHAFGTDWSQFWAPEKIAIPEYWGSVSKPPSLIGFLRKSLLHLFGR
jgi:hypothetical protein